MPKKDPRIAVVENKNTYFYYNPTFEQHNEANITALRETLVILHKNLKGKEKKEDIIVIFEDLLRTKEYGLKALQALTGVSNELFLRIITLIRIVNDKELNDLTYKKSWCTKEEVDEIIEWKTDRVKSMLKTNTHFVKGVIRLFFEGASTPYLAKTLPLFELQKFKMGKLNFDLEQLLDTIVRYKEKGSYSGKKDNNPEQLLERLLDSMSISFEKGDLTDIVIDSPFTKRRMDFIIPDKNAPRLIVECSYLVTTSSGQGDKAKTEISIKELIRARHKIAKFVGFVDGIGWLVRKGDLERMVSAYDHVFTFHEDEIDRFRKLLEETMGCSKKYD
ncbi:MAG: DpnII family type II restriction endonuclease [Candidatus Cloacimonadaceae bacterium]|nr:DpnII family type II restriction endonuclease [Candidatus Cloacimonadaceae bacterium]